MNPDEIMLLDWLAKTKRSKHALEDIKRGSDCGKKWLNWFRRWSAEGIDGATAALNAAERIYGKTLK